MSLFGDTAYIKKRNPTFFRSGFLTRVQEKIFWSKAFNLFDEDADREDFIQECYTEAWLEWCSREFKRYGSDERPDISSLDIIALNAKNRVAPRVRREKLAAGDGEIEVHSKLASQMKLADALDLAQALVKNPRKRNQYIRHRFKLASGNEVCFTTDELIELTNMKRGSLNHSKSRGTDIRLFQYQGRFFKNMADIQNQYALSVYVARKNTSLVRLSWFEAKSEAI